MACLGSKRAVKSIDALDGGHGWVIVFGSFLGHILCLGLQYSFGVTFARLVGDFHAPRSAIAWIGSLTVGFMVGMGALTGFLVQKSDERLVIVVGGVLASASLWTASFATKLWHLYITYGALLGLACSWIYFPCLLVIQKWFSKKRAVASGVASCGSGIGSMSLGPVVGWLIDSFGWRVAFRCLAVFALALSFIVGFLCRPPREGADSSKRKMSAPYLYSGNNEERALLRCFPLRLFMASACITGLGWFVPVAHVVQCARDRGFHKDFQDSLVSVMGLGLLTGRIPMCWLADRWGRRTRALVMVNAFIAVACFILSVSDSFETMALGAFLFGWNAGAYVALTPPVVKEFMTVEELSQAVGLVYSAWGWTMMFGPPLAGFIHSKTDDYLIPFLGAGCCMILGSALLLVLEFVIDSHKRQSENDKSSKVGSCVAAHASPSVAVPDSEEGFKSASPTAV